MATALSSIETQARRHLIETSASFWSSAEIVDIINNGIKDLWRPIVDLKEEYYLVWDITNVSLAADTSTLTGLPEDIYKVYLIEPRDVTSDSDNKNLHFEPLDWNHPRFRAARTIDPVSPSNNVIYYAIMGAGAPVDYDSDTVAGANITIRVAPQVSSAVNLSFGYVPSLPALTAGQEHPIPGEADQALIAWTVAWARAKEREDRTPDPGWLQVYATEKQNLLNSLGLRQYQEPKLVDAFFEQYWN
jgi:hypothetical protein